MVLLLLLRVCVYLCCFFCQFVVCVIGAYFVFRGCCCYCCVCQRSCFMNMCVGVYWVVYGMCYVCVVCVCAD